MKNLVIRLCLTFYFLNLVGVVLAINDADEKTAHWRFSLYESLKTSETFDWDHFATLYLKMQDQDSQFSLIEKEHIITGLIFMGYYDQAYQLIVGDTLMRHPSSFIQTQVQSIVFESINPENALSLWKDELLKNEENKNAEFFAALYHVIRIYHDQNLFDKADLYLNLFDNNEYSLMPPYGFTYFQAELIRNAFLKNDTKEMQHNSAVFLQNKLYHNVLSLSELLKLYPAAIADSSMQLKTYLEKLIYLKTLESVPPTELFDLQRSNPQMSFVNDSLQRSYINLIRNSFHALKKTSTILNSRLLEYQSSLDEIRALNQNKSRNAVYIQWIITIILAIVLFFIIFKIKNQLKSRNKLLKESMHAIDGEIEKLSQVSIDQDALDQRIKDKISSLQLEIKERAKIDTELKNALEKAEKANFLKNAFLANMSHEIRTPLNGIVGFSLLLENELAIMENKDLFDYANSIQQSGERLLHLLNNIIDISRLEANDMEMNLKHFDVSSVLNEVIEFYSQRAKDKGLHIVFEKSNARIFADESTLRRICMEIMDNALKYTEKGFVKLSIDENDKYLSIIIKDTGIGIDKSYLPYIFEAFRQESLGYTRQYQGAGLGIPLAKRLTEKMSGHFIVSSEKAQGTEVKIQLLKEFKQLDEEIPSGDNQEVQLETTNFKKDLRILLVEDDLASSKIMSKILEKASKLVWAQNGEEALERIKASLDTNEFFELFLFDINLPAPWDGIKLLQHIKSNYKVYENLPSIAQTAYAMGGDKQTILSAGFNGYVSKPIQKKILLAEISNLLNHNK